MRSVIITALLLMFSAGGLSAQVQTTFKTVADGVEVDKFRGSLLRS
jgi:hypothetical protein